MDEKFVSEIFPGKSLSGLMNDIYNNTSEKKAQINALIMELKPLIKDIQNATILVPLIAEYLDVGVKNDEQLIKLASIAQRIFATGNKSEDVSQILTDEEKSYLLNESKKETLQLKESNGVKKLNA